MLSAAQMATQLLNLPVSIGLGTVCLVRATTALFSRCSIQALAAAAPPDSDRILKLDDISQIIDMPADKVSSIVSVRVL